MEQALAHREAWQALIWGESWVTFMLASAGETDHARRETHRIIAAGEIGAEEDWTDAPTLLLLLSTAIITRAASSQ